MRIGLGLALFFGAMATVACGSGPDMSSTRHTAPAADEGSPAGGSQPGAVTPGDPPPNDTTTAPAAGACPTGVPIANTLALDPGAEDLRLVDGKIYFRLGDTFVRMKKDGSGRADVYKSGDLVRGWADATSMVFVEAPNGQPDLTLRATTLDGKTIFATNLTGFNAASTHVFASDDLYVYVMADVTAAGDSIYRASRTTGAVTRLANFGTGEGNDISNMQLSGYDVWFVRAGKRVYVVKQTATIDEDTQALTALTPQTQTEMFASGYDECKLAVGRDAAYCSDGKQLVRRDLTGANPTPIFDSGKSAVQAALGAPTLSGDALGIQPVGGVIRLLTPSTATAQEKIVACGMDGITGAAFDADSVVWTASKGIFIAPR